MGIAGPSGAGKTTLARKLAAALRAPRSTLVTGDGVTVIEGLFALFCPGTGALRGIGGTPV